MDSVNRPCGGVTNRNLKPSAEDAYNPTFTCPQIFKYLVLSEELGELSYTVSLWSLLQE